MNEELLVERKETNDTTPNGLKMYDKDIPPTFIEKIFGEPYSVNKDHCNNKITLSFVISTITM